MVERLDRDEHGEPEADRLGTDQGDRALDDAVRAQALDPSPARRLRQADAGSDLGDGERGIFLKNGEDPAVGTIQLSHASVLEETCCRGRQNSKNDAFCSPALALLTLVMGVVRLSGFEGTRPV